MVKSVEDAKLIQIIVGYFFCNVSANFTVLSHCLNHIKHQNFVSYLYPFVPTACVSY